MKIAIFGSAFNPPTLGHEDAVRYVLENDRNIRTVFLVPSYKHAFAKQMADYETRIEMLNAFERDLGDKRVQVRAIEHTIASPEKPVYTYDLLTHIQCKIASCDKLCFIIGPDNALNWDKFYKAEEIKNQWELIVVPERKTIRSTMVRQQLNNGENVAHLVTPSVCDYLEKNPVYG